MMPISRKTVRALVPVAVAVAFGLSGCAGEPARPAATKTQLAPPHAASPAPKPVTGNFVGRVEGTDALIALVVGEHTAAAYVCDSAEMVGGFSGAAGGDALQLAAMEGTGVANIRLGDAMASGTVQVKGVTYPFTASPATGNAGYFFASGTMRGEPFEARWIVASDGEVRGAVLIRNSGGMVAFADWDITVEADAGLPVRVVADSTTTVRQLSPEPTATSDTQVSVDSTSGYADHGDDHDGSY